MSHLISTTFVQAISSLVSIYYSTMKISHASTVPSSPPRVDVRLCGSIPRKDITDQLVQRSALCPLSDLTSSDLNASFLAANGPSSDHLTHKALAFDGLTNIASHTSMTRIQSDASSPAPVFEPPSWAVPAQGEARLEVRSLHSRLHLVIFVR